MSKRLKKSRRDRIIFGVCGGLAEYFEVDSTIVRLLFIVAFAFEPRIVLIYLLLAIVMPEEGAREFSLDQIRIRELLAYCLIALGIAILLRGLISVIIFIGYLIAILLIVAGILLLLRR
jgi:phage shock protein C